MEKLGIGEHCPSGWSNRHIPRLEKLQLHEGWLFFSRAEPEIRAVQAEEIAQALPAFTGMWLVTTCDKSSFWAGVVDVDPDQISFAVVVQHDSFGYFTTLGALLRRQIDRKRGSMTLVNCSGLQRNTAFSLSSSSGTILDVTSRSCDRGSTSRSS
jgi:hypothetical protein